MRAHDKYAVNADARLRFFDRKTPYAIHPVWCGLSILAEPKLEAKLRWQGALTLLYHDVLEDTTRKLPGDLPKKVQQQVRDMTFADIKEEMELVWSKSPEILLFKLYDKTSTMLDWVWMGKRLQGEYRQYVVKLIKVVAKAYGELNVVKIAKALVK